MAVDPAKNIAAYPSPLLQLFWLLNGEAWRLGIGEDPHWGESAIGQVLLNSSIHQLANSVTDHAARKQIQASAAAALVSAAQRIAKESA